MWLTKKSTADLSPFISVVFSRSLADGTVPLRSKMAHVTPLLKKIGLDQLDPRPCRPISNLPVVSKLLERIVANHLLSYLTSL